MRHRLIIRSAVCAAVAVASVGAALIQAPEPANAAYSTTSSIVGSPGKWLGMNAWATCMPSSGVVETGAPIVGPSLPYANYTQTIYMRPVIERAGATQWDLYQYATTPQVRTLYAGQRSVTFNTFRFSSLPSGYYHAGYIFEWYVGSTRVGRVFTYNAQNEYYFTSNPIAASGDWCYIGLGWG